MSVSFNFLSFHEAVADLTSLSPSLAGVQKLAEHTKDYTASQSQALIAECLDYGVIDWLVQSFQYCQDEVAHERTLATLHVLNNVSRTCSDVLLEPGVIEVICDLLYLGQHDVIACEAMLTLNISESIRYTVFDALAKRGALIYLCDYVAEVYTNFTTVNSEVITIAAKTMYGFAYQKHRIKSKHDAILPTLTSLLAFALRHFHSVPNLEAALRTTCDSVFWMYCPGCPDNKFFEAFIAGGDHSLFHSALELLRIDSASFASLRLRGLCESVSNYDGDKPMRAFTVSTMVYLKRIAESREYLSSLLFEDITTALLNLTNKGSVMVSRIFESNVLQAVVKRLEMKLRNETSWYFFNTPSENLIMVIINMLKTSPANDANQSRFFVALTLLEYGALRFCTQVLGAAVADTHTSSLRPLVVCEAVRLMI